SGRDGVLHPVLALLGMHHGHGGAVTRDDDRATHAAVVRPLDGLDTFEPEFIRADVRDGHAEHRARDRDVAAQAVDRVYERGENDPYAERNAHWRKDPSPGEEPE